MKKKYLQEIASKKRSGVDMEVKALVDKKRGCLLLGYTYLSLCCTGPTDPDFRWLQTKMIALILILDIVWGRDSLILNKAPP